MLNTMVQHACYKDDLMAKVGGKNQFDFLVMDFCEIIREDPRLRQFFGSFDTKSLISFQKNMLDAVFLDVNDKVAEELRAHVSLHYYRLFEMGFNERHFDALLDDFLDAMRDCWVAEDTLESCRSKLETLRNTFRKNEEAALLEAVQQRELAAEILSARAQREHTGL